MNKKILVFIIAILFLIGVKAFAEIPFSFSDPDWKGRATKTIVMALEERLSQDESNIASLQIDIAQLRAENQSLKNQLSVQEENNEQRTDETKKLLLNIILLLKKQ